MMDINGKEEKMPTKHIDEKTWKKIQEITVKAVIATQKPVKEGDVLHFLIKRGLEDLTQEDLKKIK
jgi:hypothetical protein